MLAMIHQTSTHVNKLLPCVSRKAANFLFQFFKKSGGIRAVYATYFSCFHLRDSYNIYIQHLPPTAIAYR